MKMVCIIRHYRNMPGKQLVKLLKMGNKKMNIKNYTSTVPVSKSVQNIEELFEKAGSTSISRFYENNKLAGFYFSIPIDGKPITFKVPAKPLAVKRIMEKQVKRARRGTMNLIWEQAERTAWKLLNEWVHLQLSMIQVFLPYAFDSSNNVTLFEKLKEVGFKQLTSG